MSMVVQLLLPADPPGIDTGGGGGGGGGGGRNGGYHSPPF